ncbi:MAG: hypothetical protein KJ655_05730 [Candidatus Thermoplasmatota archaeon]|nr:hypothetical protein [Candidatus Thermoplasmatota archaeon]
MVEYKIKDQSRIVFHDLSYREEDGEYFIGRGETGTYLTMPELGFRTIELLTNGLTVGECKKRLRQKYDEDVEMDTFIEDLIRVGFVRKIGDLELKDSFEKKRYWFTAVKPEDVKWLFSRPALLGYLFLITFSLLIMALNPIYIPRDEDFFFHQRYTIVLLASLGLGWLLVFKHELFHFFAGKARGIQGRFSISNRLYFVVAETDLTQLWEVPRRERYLPYLAGMFSDMLFVSVIIVTLWLNDLGIISIGTLLYGILKMLILLEFLGILWQFEFFMKTDVYYVVANFFTCKNLSEDAKSFMKNKLSRVIKRIRPRDISNIPEKEMKVIKAYSSLFIVGTAVAIYMFLFYILPITIEMYGGALSNMLKGYYGNEELFIDGLTVVSITTFEFLLLGLSIWLKHRKKKVLEA